MIELKNLHFSYRTQTGEIPVLRGINLSFRPGESVAIIGANGSGKTTLIRCINCLLQPTSGDILVDGLSVSDPENAYEIRSRAGMVFQNPDDQIVSAQVEREIAFGLENLGVPTEEIQARIHEMLERFSLGRYRSQSPHLLSGGERQRLAIASVLAMRPRYLLLDEPTALLDPGSRRSLLNLLETLHEEITSITVTQLPEEAARAQRIVALYKGQVVMDGLPQDIFSQIDELTRIGLSAPVSALIAHRLGLSPPLPLTPEALADRLPPPSTQPAPNPEPPPSPTGQPIIQAKKLRHIYNQDLPSATVALHDLDLDVPQQSVLALIGPSGSGKSTFAQHLNGLLSPASGELTVCGIDVVHTRNLNALRRRVGLIFQFPEAQLFADTVFEDIAFGPRNLGLDNIETRVNQALHDVGLTPESFLHRSPFALSGGEKRRVAIAGVLAMHPDVLILDEPTAGLDPSGAAEIESLLRRLNTEGTTLLLISHDMDLVARLADRVVALDQGRLAFNVLPPDAFSDPKRLQELDLDVPEAVRVAHCLRDRGWPIPSYTLTVEAIVECISKNFRQ
ncbi:MAG: energy-coupling factor transporter ATPase [bacterium]|nr:energy-coupling factor transporter ATPase [bacterium]